MLLAIGGGENAVRLMHITDIIVLAAGKGTRMKSALPKVLHELAGQPLLAHVLDAAGTVAGASTVVVIGHGAEQVAERFADSGVTFVEQHQQLGTAHAVQVAEPHMRDNSVVLILYGDVPLIEPATINAMLASVSEHTLSLLTVRLDDPSGYGRILRDDNDQVQCIVEHKDATPEQLMIHEVNTGVMALHSARLREWLPRIDNKNAQGEYYLTDLIAIARDAGVRVHTVHPASKDEVEGVNSREQLSRLERVYQQRQAQSLMAAGTSLADPLRFDVRGRLSSGMDNFIDVNCVFEGDVQLGNNVRIGPNCHIIDSDIGDGVEIKSHSVIEGAHIGPSATVGPFARLRPGTRLAEGSKVGNFVETKKAQVGKHSKINHLSYVGDAELGENVNVGAGTITCNYDGVNKHKTEIGDAAFIGSNTSLVAPVVIGKGATVGAGSTISKSVPDGELALTRARQVTVPGWKRPEKKSK